MKSAGLAVVAVCAAALLLLVIQDQRSRTIFEADSEFGDVRVAERSDGLRSLYTGEGRARQSAIYPDRPMHLEHAYTRVGMIGAALVPPRGRMLFVGLGGGAMPMYARQILPDALIDVVEIDPVIVAVAQRYFGFTPDERITVHTGDGRAFIERAPPATYDLIVLDAFSDDEVPFSLTTREFLAAVRAALTPAGVVVSNLWTAAAAYPSMLATYQAVFDHAHLLRVPRHAQRILVAGAATRPLDRTALLRAAQALARRVRLGFDLPALVAQGYEAMPAPNAPVLHDRAGTAAPLSGLRLPFARSGPRTLAASGRPPPTDRPNAVRRVMGGQRHSRWAIFARWNQVREEVAWRWNCHPLHSTPTRRSRANTRARGRIRRHRCAGTACRRRRRVSR